jgi:nucleotide-binding universal stress UspA family protein
MTGSKPSVIVVGVDATPAAQAALTFAMREARLRGSALDVVTTWVWDVDSGNPSLGIPSLSAPTDVAARVRAAQDIAISAALTATAAPPVITRHVIEGLAGEELVRIARTADYLVVGSTHKNVLKRALLGSVSEYCVRHATCPVVVVPGTSPVAETVAVSSPVTVASAV